MAPSVALFRVTFGNSNFPSFACWPAKVVSVIVASPSAELKTIFSPSVFPSISMRVLASQPDPGNPPGKNTARNAPLPNAITCAPRFFSGP
ncbi:MAG: hypothetical protein DME26_18285 [Verrucomicrobia bacterium]|nr:MAG: hypothetical protein DME26_18285 [Verrucomicrobiota bacterium]